jgi:hypothetical protein
MGSKLHLKDKYRLIRQGVLLATLFLMKKAKVLTNRLYSFYLHPLFVIELMHLFP